MKHIILIPILFLMSCDRETEYSVTPELQPYIDSFYREAESRGVTVQRTNLIVRLADLSKEKGNIKGRTIRDYGTFSDHQITIYIDQGYYDACTTKGYQHCLESVVFHECGHAFFGRKHIEGESIMNNWITHTCWRNGNQEVRKALIDELFTNR